MSSLADKLRQLAVVINTTYQMQTIKVVKPIKINSRRVCVQLTQIKLQTTSNLNDIFQQAQICALPSIIILQKP